MALKNNLIAWMVLVLVVVILLTSEAAARDLRGTSSPCISRGHVRELLQLRNRGPRTAAPRGFNYFVPVPGGPN